MTLPNQDQVNRSNMKTMVQQFKQLRPTFQLNRKTKIKRVQLTLWRHVENLRQIPCAAHVSKWLVLASQDSSLINKKTNLASSKANYNIDNMSGCNVV
mgnify:CR=1 FL=1